MKMRNKVMIHTKEAQLRKTMHLKKMNFQKDDNPSYFIQIMRKQLILKILKFWVFLEKEHLEKYT